MRPTRAKIVRGPPWLRPFQPTRRWASPRRSASAIRFSWNRTSTSWSSGFKSRTTSRSSPADTRSKPAPNGSTRTTPRSFAASSKGGTSSTACPASCAMPHLGRPADSGRSPSAARTARTSPRRLRARGEGLRSGGRPADRCCSTFRAPAPMASRATRPAPRTSTTKSSRCSSRTDGRPATA